MVVRRWLPMLGVLLLLPAAAGVGMASDDAGITPAPDGYSARAGSSLSGQVEAMPAGSAANQTEFQVRMARIQGLLNELSEIMARDEDVIRTYERGRVAFNQGTESGYREAEIAYEEAVRLRPAEGDYQYSLGLVLLAQEKYPEAETAFRAARDADSTVAANHYGLGTALLAQNKDAEAESAFREAQRIEPASAGYHYALGLALMDQDKNAEAEQAFSAATQRDGDVAAYHVALSTALTRQQKHSEAAAAFREAQRIDPTLTRPPIRTSR
jgi:tetratricopeptide (TPR) repeat protein